MSSGGAIAGLHLYKPVIIGGSLLQPQVIDLTQTIVVGSFPIGAIGTISSNLIPGANLTYTVGTVGAAWSEGYFGTVQSNTYQSRDTTVEMTLNAGQVGFPQGGVNELSGGAVTSMFKTTNSSLGAWVATLPASNLYLVGFICSDSAAGISLADGTVAWIPTNTGTVFQPNSVQGNKAYDVVNGLTQFGNSRSLMRRVHYQISGNTLNMTQLYSGLISYVFFFGTSPLMGSVPLARFRGVQTLFTIASASGATALVSVPSAYGAGYATTLTGATCEGAGVEEYYTFTGTLSSGQYIEYHFLANMPCMDTFNGDIFPMSIPLGPATGGGFISWNMTLDIGVTTSDTVRLFTYYV